MNIGRRNRLHKELFRLKIPETKLFGKVFFLKGAQILKYLFVIMDYFVLAAFLMK